MKALTMKKFPSRPKNPERICWGCDQYCSTDAMSCGNGAERTPHPMELFGDDWQEWQPPEGRVISINAVLVSEEKTPVETDRTTTSLPEVISPQNVLSE